MPGPSAIVVGPSRSQPLPGDRRHGQTPRSRARCRPRRRSAERAGPGAKGVPLVAGPQAPLPTSPMPAEPARQRAADHQPERRRHDQPADDLERGPGQDQAEPDADEDERPERPPAVERRRDAPARTARANGAGDDEEDAPAEMSRSMRMAPRYAHGRMPPRAVLASAAGGVTRPGRRREGRMRLSDWRGRAPTRTPRHPRSSPSSRPILATLGREPDPDCWIVWGDDPGRPLPRVRADRRRPPPGPRPGQRPQEGPRASAQARPLEPRPDRRARRSRSRRATACVSFQVEGQVLRGSDDDADAIAAFALRLFAAIDGRPSPRGADEQAREPARPAADRPRSGAASRRAAAPRVAELDGPVIFDLDGVLVDSEIWWDEVRQAFAGAHGGRGPRPTAPR